MTKEEQDVLDQQALKDFQAFVAEHKIILKISRPVFGVNDSGQMELLEEQKVIIATEAPKSDDVAKETNGQPVKLS